MRPTISCFRDAPASRWSASAPAPRLFFGRRTRSHSLISLFRSMRRYTSTASRRPLSLGSGSRRAAVRRRRRDQVRQAGALEDAAELIGADERANAISGVITCRRDEVRERLLHRLHSARRARLHHRVDLLDLRLADQVADRVVGDEDLERGRPAEAVCGRDEGLRDDALERRGELDADLALLLGREDVDDAVDRGRRALGVQRREHEVAGLGRGERGGDSLQVAHLADEDHVGVLAERGAQAFGEGRRVSGRSRAG